MPLTPKVPRRVNVSISRSNARRYTDRIRKIKRRMTARIFVREIFFSREANYIFVPRKSFHYLYLILIYTYLYSQYRPFLSISRLCISFI